MRIFTDLLSRPRQAAGAALTLGLLLAGLATLWQTRFNQTEASRHFQELSRRGAEQVEAQMRRYEYGLRGARGTVLGAGTRGLSRRDFSDYSASRDIDIEFPGARGFGVIKRVPAEQEATFVEAARRDGAPDFRVHGFAPHFEERFVILYVEPARNNVGSMGLDIASEPHRRRAAELSMSSGQAALTAPITLVQATGSPERAFLLLLPIFKSGTRPHTTEEREAAAIGWSFAPLVIDDVLKNIDLSNDKFTFALSDTTDPETHDFFASPGSGQPAANGLAWQTHMPVYGRTWRLQTKATPAFIANLQQPDPRLLALAGTAIALLMATLAYVLSQSASRARLVQAEQARHSAIVESSADAIVGETLDGVITDWNSGAERLFGLSAATALGRRVDELILPVHLQAEHAHLHATVARGERIGPFDTTRLRHDGSRVEVSLAASPIFAAQGRCVGLSTTLRDITDARLMQDALVELNLSLERQVAERTASLDAALHDLRAILDAVPSMIGYWDTQLVNRVANRAYGEWCGRTPDDLRGRSMSEVLDPVFLARIMPRARAALAGERQTFEHSAPKADGSGWNHWLVHYLPDVVDGEVRGFYVMLHDVSELTQSRLRLAAAQRDNTALLNTLHNHASVLVTDAAGSILDVNDKFCLISGYTREELIGQNPRIIRSDVQDTAFWGDMWRTIASGKPWRNEACNRSKDGTLYWMDCTIAPFFGEDGEIEKFVSIRTDITQRKAAEEALNLTNVRFDIASGSAGIGVWEHDVARGRLIWDARMFQLYGHPADTGRNPYRLWRKALHRDDRQRVEEALAEAMDGRGELDIEFRILTPEGETRHLRAAARTVCDAQGRVLRLTGVNFDISKRMRAELELRETSTLLKTVLASASEVSIIASDPFQVINVFNAGAERLLGYTSEEIVGRMTPVLIHDAEEIEARGRELTTELGHVVQGGAVFTEPSTLGVAREWTYVRKDGLRVPVSLVVMPMFDHAGVLSGYLGIAHDVSRQKAQERSLREAVETATQATSAKSQFLANMSHEIRTPLNAILGMLTLVQRTQLTPRQHDYISKTEAAAQSLLGLLNDILDFSKVEAGKMELDPRPFQLDKVMRNLAVILSANVGSKHVEVLFDVNPDVPRHLVGDDLRLQQILINLGGNAVKFTAQGEVVVSVRRHPAADGSLALQFSVRDTGIGISAANQERIFSGFTQAEASTTRRFGGTGLGLAICRRLITLMGGDLTLSSTPGQGTTFFFTLPFPEAAPPLDKPLLPSGGASLHAANKPRRVLVVDDHHTARELLRDMATSLGWQADVAASGEEALVLMEAAKAAGTDYGAVFVDWQMPGIDGWETCLRIRQMEDPSQATSVVVMVTAHGREALSQQSEERQKMIDGFLVKPITSSMMFDSVAEAAVDVRESLREHQRRLQGLRLLLVEDNLNNQQIAVELLEAEGASVQVAGNGKEGVAAVASASPGFDAVLMDLQMPEMDGFEATTRIRQWLGQTSLPIIAMTANALSSERDACFAAGMNDHVGKPFDLTHLVEVLLRHTGRASQIGQRQAADAVQACQVPEAVLAQASQRGIDLAAALRRTGGNQGAYLRMLRSFLTEAAGVAAQMRTHLGGGDRVSAARLMHTMKGLSGTLGAQRLYDITARAETELAADAPQLATVDEQAAWLHPIDSAFAQAGTDLAWLLTQLAPAKATPPASAQTPVDLAALRAQLHQLTALLGEGDMAAMDVFAQLEAIHGNLLGDCLQALDQAMSALDFGQALSLCQTLAHQFDE
ncbi:MAG: PAS domain S-box protein [Pseudomonadota bacterium]